jgi:hypothetical protein
MSMKGSNDTIGNRTCGHSGEIQKDRREMGSESVSCMALTSGGSYCRAFVSIMLIFGVITRNVLSC